jgi:hypothetical protein
MTRHGFSFGTVLCALLASAVVFAQQRESRCADCHFANPDAPRPDHLSAWDHSAHGRNRVGCESCHGGDPSTFEPLPAHRAILPASNPASPLRRENLPVTCGKCHTGPFVAFQKSKHYGLLRGGDRAVPTCATCHGEVAATLMSPRGLEERCTRCHGPGKAAPRTDYAPDARRWLEGVREARELLKHAEELIRHVKDPARRAALERSAQQAAIPLVEATHAGHEFVFEQLAERLETARSRIAAVYDRLANPEQ